MLLRSNPSHRRGTRGADPVIPKAVRGVRTDKILPRGVRLAVHFQKSIQEKDDMFEVMRRDESGCFGGIGQV